MPFPELGPDPVGEFRFPFPGGKRRNIHRGFSFVYPDGKCVSPGNGAIVVPAGTIPAGSGIFRGSKKSPHRAGGNEQDPLFRLFFRNRGRHDVRGAPRPHGGGKGSAPRAPGSPVARLFLLRRKGLLRGEGGDAGERKTLLPERGREASP